MMVKKGYRNPPYHNWMHAFSVTHFCYTLFKNCPQLEKMLTDLEILALFISCMCHDIDHRGTNNAFQETSVGEWKERERERVREGERGKNEEEEIQIIGQIISHLFCLFFLRTLFLLLCTALKVLSWRWVYHSSRLLFYFILSSVITSPRPCAF